MLHLVLLHRHGVHYLYGYEESGSLWLDQQMCSLGWGFAGRHPATISVNDCTLIMCRVHFCHSSHHPVLDYSMQKPARWSEGLGTRQLHQYICTSLSSASMPTVLATAERKSSPCYKCTCNDSAMPVLPLNSVCFHLPSFVSPSCYFCGVSCLT